MPSEPTAELRIGVFYPDLLNIYADRGNILFLTQRCRWRNIKCEVSAIEIGIPFQPDAFDLLYIGGGQDRDQRICAQDLADTQRDALQEAVAMNTLTLGICGGYQLLGKRYQTPQDDLPGAGLLDIETQQNPTDKRLIGPIVIEFEIAPGQIQRLAGFENHAGRTTLQSPTQPLGQVIAGHGNDGTSKFEGAQKGPVLGTYMHGPLLPKNAWFADWIIAQTTGIELSELEPLDDTLETAAHQTALQAAGIV